MENFNARARVYKTSISHAIKSQLDRLMLIPSFAYFIIIFYHALFLSSLRNIHFPLIFFFNFFFFSLVYKQPTDDNIISTNNVGPNTGSADQILMWIVLFF
jgi:hypothetical protein